MALETNTNHGNNPENERFIFKNALEEEVMTEAYTRARKILETQSIKPEQFADTYSEKLLASCQQYVEEHEAKFEKSDNENEQWPRAEVFGKTLEGILHDQINKGVYGDDVRGVSTAPYDDYHAGVDEVLERQGPGGSTYIGCALDFTFGSPDKKIERIQNDILSGRLKDVTFYESPFGDPPHIHGRLQGIPKVVVGMDAPNLLSLAQQWVYNDTEGLQQNHLFLNILRQIEMQAEVYEIVARQHQQAEVADRYKRVLHSVSELYRQLKTERGVVMLDESVTKDAVNLALREKLSELMQTRRLH